MRKIDCGYCKGLGQDRARPWVPCKKCKGRRYILIPEDYTELCGYCKGQAVDPARTWELCPVCHGNMYLPEEVTDDSQQIEEINWSMPKLLNKENFEQEVAEQIRIARELHDLYPINDQTVANITFQNVDDLSRRLKGYDSYCKEMLKRAFNVPIEENEYLETFSRLIHINDGLIMMPIASSPNLPAAEIIKTQVILENMYEYFEDLQNKLPLIPEVIDSESIPEIDDKNEKVLLIITSNPDDQIQLNFPLELRELRQRVRESKEGFRIRIEARTAVRPQDILTAINETEPDFLHFTGHGDENSLVIQGNDNNTVDLTSEMFIGILESCRKPISLVVLSACESHEIARDLVEHVDFCIGMNDDISDEAATAFSAQLYSSFAFGQSVQMAFKQGTTAILLTGNGESQIPQLYVRDGISAGSIRLM